MKQFYTYLHCKPNGDPFYVGKGCGVRSHDFHGRNQHHKRIVAKHGKENIEVLVFSRESEQASFDDEIKWIQVLREAGHELANLCDGGEGSSGALRSPETRAKMSKAQKGKSRSAESCKKQSVRMTGKKRSIDFINKISAIQKGNKRALGHNRRKSTEINWQFQSWVIKTTSLGKNILWMRYKKSANPVKQDEPV